MTGGSKSNQWCKSLVLAPDLISLRAGAADLELTPVSGHRSGCRAPDWESTCRTPKCVPGVSETRGHAGISSANRR